MTIGDRYINIEVGQPWSGKVGVVYAIQGTTTYLCAPSLPHQMSYMFVHADTHWKSMPPAGVFKKMLL
jgi:hypothetical protein